MAHEPFTWFGYYRHVSSTVTNIWILLQSASFKLLLIGAKWRKLIMDDVGNTIKTAINPAAVGVLDIFLSEAFHFPAMHLLKCRLLSS